MNRVLVTGCNGYIGSHVVKLLKEDGYHVEGWDINVYNEDHNDVTHFLDKFYYQDITQLHLNTGLPISTGFDTIIHLAGRPIVPRSFSEPFSYYQNNLSGTHSLLHFIDTNHFIYGSSSSCFENLSPYARSKSAGEDIVRELAVNYTILRFFNVSGSDGQHHMIGPCTRLIRSCAQAILEDKHVKIFGTDYPTPDGTAVRSYTSVNDIANGIVESTVTGPRNTNYENFGNPKCYSVREVIDAMKSVTDEFKVIEAPRRIGDPAETRPPDSSNLITHTQTLEEMCLETFLSEMNKKSDTRV